MSALGKCHLHGVRSGVSQILEVSGSADCQDVVQFVVGRFGRLEKVSGGDLFGYDWFKAGKNKVVRGCGCRELIVVRAVIHKGVDNERVFRGTVFDEHGDAFGVAKRFPVEIACFAFKVFVGRLEGWGEILSGVAGEIVDYVGWVDVIN